MKTSLKTKLRIRFMALSMAALLILQGMIIAVSIYHNYTDMVSKSDAILTQLRQNPSPNVRYFSVKVHPGKGAIRPDVVQHVSVTPEEAGRYGKAALESGQDKGFVGDYRYHICRNTDGIQILFLSRSSSIEMLRTAAENLIWISALSLLAVGVILIPVSGWVVTPLVENHRKQKQFITAASHELKTPLAVISADAQLLRSELGDSEWIDGILEQVDHLTQMTQDLVALSKSEEYDHIVIKERFSLSGAIEEELAAYAGLAKQTNINLTSSIIPAYTYTGCEKELRQLVRILLDNAFKYCPASGDIHIALKPHFGSVRLSISNSTAALPPSQAPALTQRFYRGQNAAGTKGFGLGLSIAQNIAKHHNGNLTVSVKKNGMFLAELTLR